jgi:hypothetical protein
MHKMLDLLNSLQIPSSKLREPNLESEVRQVKPPREVRKFGQMV